MIELLALCRHRARIEAAAAWFHQKWGIDEAAYLKSMEAMRDGLAVPQWYLAVEDGQIVGGLGVIENDFHDRKDLAPNVCAVFVEPSHRGRGLAGRLLEYAVTEQHAMGVDTLYLLTDHVGFYERYGWTFFCLAQGDGEETPSRLYVHRYITCT